MTIPRLLGFVYLTLAVLAVSSGLPWLFPVLCLAGLPALGELWLRALAGEPPSPVARLGLGIAAGLVSLPLIAVVLHLARVPFGTLPRVAGLAGLASALGAVALLRERSGRPAAADPRLPGTVAAVAVPVVLVLLVGGAAALAYVRLPHPPPPGYTSVALNGWAAGIDRPVDIPARGLSVPIRVSSAGEPSATVPLRVRVGDRPARAARPVAVAADTTRAVEVHVPAPPDGCLHRIEISLGAATTVFYGRGPAPC